MDKKILVNEAAPGRDTTALVELRPSRFGPDVLATELRHSKKLQATTDYVFLHDSIQAPEDVLVRVKRNLTLKERRAVFL